VRMPGFYEVNGVTDLAASGICSPTLLPKRSWPS
jgi:hypothetical protein